MRRWQLVWCLCLAVGSAAFAEPEGEREVSSIDYSMYFLSDVRDSPECDLTIDEAGRFDFGPTVTNPAMSCPDAFAWRIFVEAVEARFWEAWSTNEQLWPHAPWPRCGEGETGDCCPALERTNEADPEHCPVFPGATPGVPAHQPHVPTKAHQTTLAEAASGDADGDGLADWDDVPAVFKNPVIGAEQVELIYRNEPMAEYVFANELYSTEGISRVFATAETSLRAYAPHRAERPDPTSYEVPVPIDAIDLPIDAVMVKVNWLDATLAPKVGIDPDGEHPFVVMDLVDAKDGETKPFLLLSFHMSSKHVPNWTWSTFEHVDNQGRCDWIGCNDSFGWWIADDDPIVPAPAHDLAPPARNFVPPHQAADIDGAGVRAFDVARRYPSETISRALDALFRRSGIGIGPSGDAGLPSPSDPAWRSYRLKGTQTDFVTARGRPTRLGNSVTEAGFTNSSSCITCHSRAAAGSEGRMAFSIFADELSADGFPKSVSGIPNQAWFHRNAYWGVGGQREAPELLTIQTDFVWGFRHACPIDRAGVGPDDRCAEAPTMPTRP